MPRDKPESAFATILAALVARVPGARAAALVDFEGETVDYAGRGDPYQVRVAAAHWRITFDQILTQSSLRDVCFVVVRAARRSYFVRALPEGYALVMELVRGAGSVRRRAIDVCIRALGEEAGWSRSDGGKPSPWFPVEVVVDIRRRPRAVRQGDLLRPLEILGVLASRVSRDAAAPQSRPRERAWRVRFDTGVESMLLREPGGVWYTDEPLESAPEPRSAPSEKIR